MKAKSKRCGRGSCKYYEPSNNISKCELFSDRSQCSISNKQRRKSANHSRRYQKEQFGY